MAGGCKKMTPKQKAAFYKRVIKSVQLASQIIDHLAETSDGGIWRNVDLDSIACDLVCAEAMCRRDQRTTG